MAAIKDVVETHRLWSEYLLALIQTFEGEASNYVSTFSTANRERVSGYRNLLWIWHRLDLARWNMSKVPLRAGKKEKTVAEVDHCVSFVLWEDKLKSGLPAKLPDLDDARAVANQLGNCALLEKNFNISKGSKSMKSFLEQIHEFKENKISLNDWASALAMPKELIDSEGASVDAIVGAIEYRDTAVRADLIEFVRGQKVRQDI